MSIEQGTFLWWVVSLFKMHLTGGVNQFNSFIYLNNLALLRVICFGFNKQTTQTRKLFFFIL